MKTVHKSSLDLSELNWVDGKELSKRVKTAIIPIGATEQHGPHLPIGTDTFILQGIMTILKKDLGPDYPVMFLPTLPIGKSPEHLNFFGTISLKSSTLISVLDDICFCLKKHGFSKVVFLNSHGGNLDLLKSILFDIREKYDMLAFCVYPGGYDGWDGPDFVNKMFPGLTTPECHAGSVETSLIAYLHPDLIKEPEDFNQKMSIPDFPFGWETTDLSDNGVIGNPKFYSTEAGQAALMLEVKKIHLVLDQILRIN